MLYLTFGTLFRRVGTSIHHVGTIIPRVGTVKITPFGYYMINTLCFQFNYLDLVSLDCGIHNESVCHTLTNLAQKDIDLFLQFKKLERVQVRLKRTQVFLDYLKNEEELELAHYSVDPAEIQFAPTLLEKFAREKQSILISARKNYGKAPSRDFGEADLWDDTDHPASAPQEPTVQSPRHK